MPSKTIEWYAYLNSLPENERELAKKRGKELLEKMEEKQKKFNARNLRRYDQQDVDAGKAFPIYRLTDESGEELGQMFEDMEDVISTAQEIGETDANGYDYIVWRDFVPHSSKQAGNLSNLHVYGIMIVKDGERVFRKFNRD